MPRPAPRRTEKKTRAWPVVIGLVVVGLAAWGFSEAVQEEPEVEIEEVEAAPPTGVGEGSVTDGPAAAPPGVGAIAAAPETHVDSTFPALRVEVAEVATDRSFWIAGGGSRVLAVVTGASADGPAEMREGDSLLLTGATVRRASWLEEGGGAGLDEATLALAGGQDVVLVVEGAGVRPASAPGRPL